MFQYLNKPIIRAISLEQYWATVNYELDLGKYMAATERGSLIWFMMAVTQIWLSLKLMEEVDAAITSLFGTGAAACFLLALVVFRKEQREMVLNPMGHIEKEVHQDSIKKQGKGVMWAVGSWILALIFGSILL